MPELEKIKGRVRKLLSLSRSDNENEAASALEKANLLIAGYGLDGDSLQFESVRVKAGKTVIRWKNVTANSVGWLYGCYAYHSRDGAYTFTGDPLYVFMAGEMYGYLVRAIERIAKKQIRKNAKLNYRRDFKYGMAARLSGRIYEMGERCSWAPGREGMRESAEEFVTKEIAIAAGTLKTAGTNSRAFLKGALAADGVSLTRQTGQAPARQIAGRGGMVQRELF
jgi:hypothetical protein